MATMKTLNGYGFNATELNGKTSDNYLKKNDTASNSKKLGGKAPEYYLQPRNLLDNSDFRNPVNQRGASSYTGEGYTIDRWLIPISGVTLYKNVDSISVTGLFFQYVPAETISNPRAIHTLMFRTKDGRTKILSKAMNVAYSIDDNIGIGFGYDAVLQKYIVASANADEYIWAALYEGSYTAETLPPYVPKGYAAELAECMRYYYRLENGTHFISRVRNQHETSNYAAFDICPCITFPVPMRIVPTVSITYDITDGTLSVGAPFDCSRTSCTVPDVSIPHGGWFDLDGLVASADL